MLRLNTLPHRWMQCFLVEILWSHFFFLIMLDETIHVYKVCEKLLTLFWRTKTFSGNFFCNHFFSVRSKFSVLVVNIIVCEIFLKDVFFGGEWNELFGPNKLGPSIIFVWPQELVRVIGNCLENIFIVYHVVIRRLKKFLRVCEVELQPFHF